MNINLQSWLVDNGRLRELAKDTKLSSQRETDCFFGNILWKTVTEEKLWKKVEWL